MRHLLTYYQYATSESREDVLRAEINKVREAADDLRDRYRAQYNGAPVDATPINSRLINNVERDEALEEAQTTVINGRHHRLA